MGWRLGDVERVGVAENETNNGVWAAFGVALHQGHEMCHAAILKPELAQGAHDERPDRLRLKRVAANEKVPRPVFVAVSTRRVRFELARGFCRVGSSHTNEAFVVSPERTGGAASEEDSIDKKGGVSVRRCHIEKPG